MAQRSPGSRGTRRVRVLTLALAVALIPLAGELPARAVASETPIPSWGTGPLPPSNPSGKEWQDGRVYALARGNGRIYVGGKFTQAVAPDGTTVPRAGLMALHADTGELDLGFDPNMNGQEVRALAVSPDGTRLFVGGRFTAIGGAVARNLAALDATTGLAVPGWRADTDQMVMSLTAAGGRVYAGGKFTNITDSAGQVNRAVLASLDAGDGTVDAGWNPTVTGCASSRNGCVGPYVQGMAVSADGRRLFVGGAFDHIDGQTRLGLGAVIAATGDVDLGFRPAGNREVYALATDGLQVYSALGGGGGAGMAYDATTGQEAWTVLGGGNFQGVAVMGGLVYLGGHFGPGDARLFTDAAGTIVPRNKLAAVDAVTGAVHPYAPVVNSPLGVFVVRGSGNRLDIGGDFTQVGPAGGPAVEANHFAQLPVTLDPTPPGAPSSVAAVPGDGSVTVSWVAPVSDGGSAITAYTVTPRVGGTAGTATTFASTATTQTIGGLTNGVAYTFTVAATNADGLRGPESAPSAPVTPFGPPGAPGGVKAAAGDGTAKVSWSAPAVTGGNPITGYVVTPHAGGTAGTPSTFASSATTQTIGGLTNGVAYTFTVAATNAAGTGAESAPSTPVIPGRNPGAPSVVSVVPGDGAVTVSWSAPADDGGLPVTAYMVTPYADGTAGTAGTPSMFASTATTQTVGGLTNGVAYTFTVAATNAAGTGPDSAPSTPVVPRTKPGAPSGVSAVPGDGSATVSWSAPAGDGGSPITAYLVTPHTGGTAGTPRTFASTATTQTVGGLANGIAYTFTVAAANAAGAGPASTPSAPVTPRALVQVAGEVQATGYWLLGVDGNVFAFGEAQLHGRPAAGSLAGGAVDLEGTPSHGGYWIVDRAGQVQAFGDAPFVGNVPAAALAAGEEVTSLARTPTGSGYWIFTSRGRVFPFGDARHLGDLSGIPLNGPVLDSIPTPSGNGYYMVASDGGIFTFGDAVFAGSMGDTPLNAPVQSAVPDPGGEGYWLVASDGGVFSFHAPFRGSAGGLRLNAPVTGMVSYGDGYLLVATDGGVFNYSDRVFSGSLGANPPARPIVSVAALG